jgi:asparagine synthase (glutamine-hydrolysing)
MRRFLVYVNEMVDATSAAFALEDRPAFQDVTLATMAFSMPEYIKNRDGPSDFKPFLKKALRGLVPDEVLLRRKKGFPAPDDSSYARRLRALLQSEDLIFGLNAETIGLDTLGISELIFLWSTLRWCKIRQITL